ncbi:MBL fold metallo-hydrolase [Halomicrobium salinisoli]|uniref:MBL fold metallo-hydrolase n=1 Tax=Halomicrobium salinisoli TaxID=2878391 RepID=UPI001CEFCE18|nr:MBL fold metallo-hydrolase [Halomicrobium salinisoli]
MPRTLELPSPDEPADLERGSIFFVGTATVILRYAGFTILTDPNFLHRGDHVHLGYGLTSERRTDPAIDVDELPPDLDFVLLSHYHGDHFDRVAEARLDRDLPIVTTHHAAERLAGKGFRATYPLETWETLRVRKGDVDLDVTATPARHGPPVVSKALPQVMGSVLEFGRSGETLFRGYISGDTVLYDDLAAIPEQFPGIDVALLHLGGTRILGLLLTMDAEQGVEMVRLIDADTSIPIHCDDYDVFQSPRADFEAAVERAGLEDRVAYLDRGERYEFQVPLRRT